MISAHQMTNPAQNLAEVNEKIALAAERSARTPGDVVLVAISKVHGEERIRPVIEAGHRVFGENRVQEAQQKWPGLKAEHPDLKLHLVGPLQTNKAKEAVELFDVIETVDREKLARKLAQEMAAQERHPKLFIQINTGEEAQKAGVLPREADDFIALCRGDLGLEIEGLMCIPPVEEEVSLHFMLLAAIAKRNGLTKLSMGMSGDYEAAIEFGATHVRVGTAIFGERPAKE